MGAVRVVIDIREDDLWKELEAYRPVTAAIAEADATAGAGAIASTAVASAVASDGWYVEQAALDVGDIAFYCPVGGASDGEGAAADQLCVVLERKTAEDLGASQKDGRYREQRARLYALRGAKVAIGYIVEAPHWSPSLSRTWCRGTFNEVNLQQAIVRLQLRYTIPVLQSASLKETVGWIRRIAKSLAADPTVFQSGVATTAAEAASVYTEAIHVKKADNATPERIFRSFLLAIPGLGKSSVDAIATATSSSFLALQTMTLDQLCELKAGKRKLGATTATAIFNALHS
jgi:ERCC4-type nuclease